jgi:integrase/recombinase XerD
MRFCPVVLSPNGRVKPDLVLVNGTEERHPEGAYYIEWRNGAKRVRLSVGKDAADAVAQRQRKEAELNAVNNGVAVQDQSQNSAGKRSVQEAIASFLEDTKDTKKPKTLAAYTTSLKYFTESCSKLYVEDIQRKDLLKFSAFLRDEKKQAQRSVRNKFENVMSFLKAQGIRGLVGKNDWPRFVEEEPEIYEKKDLQKFFAACNAEERLWFEFFLMTGMREQEVMYTYWKDIKFTASVVRVSHKPDRGWTPKAYKEREIPVPGKLTRALKKLHAKSKRECPLVFPTSGCKPKNDFLDCCKTIAKRAGLNCGQCDGCKGKSTWCENWFLHKFRATFATWHLWKGVDIRTVQNWLGHSDMESTMRYLKPAGNQAVRDKVNETFA